jgi:hypothetical protein
MTIKHFSANKQSEADIEGNEHLHQSRIFNNTELSFTHFIEFTLNEDIFTERVQTDSSGGNRLLTRKEQCCGLLVR